MPKAKSKSTMPGRTKKRHTKRTASRKTSAKKLPISLGSRKYSVPEHVYMRLLNELEPHRSDKGELLSFEEFFEASDSSPPEWATNLRGLRYREDLTQAEFAEAIGIPQSNLSAMENGKRSIGKDLAKRIADTFKTDYRYFL